MNIVLLKIAQYLWQACGCLEIPKGPKEKQVKCTRTNAQPGIPCVIPNLVFKQLYKLSFNMWKAYQSSSHTCFNPITPYN